MRHRMYVCAVVAPSLLALATAPTACARPDAEPVAASEAQRKLTAARQHLRTRSGPVGGLGSQIADRDRLLWQRAASIVRKHQQTARDAAVASPPRFDQARQAILAARHQLEAAKPYARPVSRYESLRDQLDSLARHIDDQARRHRKRQRENAVRDAERAAARRGQAMRTERQDRIDGLFAQARQYRSQRRFQDAVDALDGLLAIDPTDDRARALRRDFERSQALADQKSIQDDVLRQAALTRNDVLRARIPWHRPVMYPRNWPEITDRRRRHDLGQAVMTDATREAHRQLSQPVAELMLDDITFENVLTHLRDLTGLNLHVNWRAIEFAGIEREARLTLHLRGVELAKALQLILDDAGADGVELGYVVDEGVVQISTVDDLSRKTSVRVYSVQDLLIPDPTFRTPLDLGILGLLGAGMAGTGGGLGMAGPGMGGPGMGAAGLGAPGPGGLPGTGEAEDEDSRDDLVDEILELLRETVNPDTWRGTVGDIGSIRELRGALIVTQTADAHEQMLDLLRQDPSTYARTTGTVGDKPGD